MARRIDGHQHFWTRARGDYGWLTPELGPLYRDFAPPDLEPSLAAAGIAETLLVQAAPTLAETEFLLEIKAETSFVAGVVGWLDFERPAPRETLTGLAKRGLVGLRPMIQDVADPDWMLRPALAPAFEALVALDLTFDALVRPVHLPRLRELREQHPKLRIVIDHAGKPDVAGGAREPWASDLRALSGHPGTFCKLSGLASEAGADWTAGDLRPYAEHVLACFGPERVLWGSDWPVVEAAGGFAAWWRATGELLAPLSAAERDAVLGENAVRVYGLEPEEARET